MRLDHFVVHVDNDEKFLADLKSRIEPLGFPFEPKWGKGTKGFKAANIWIGRQYFEIIRLLRPDGGGWTPHWVKQYNAGTRGLSCLFLATDDIDAIATSLKKNGVSVTGPERTSFKALFGLVKKTLPWRFIYLPKIPGTEMEVGFIQYDPDPTDRIKQYLVPNSDGNGISGISSAAIHLPLTDESIQFLSKLFPNMGESGDDYLVQMQPGELRFKNSAKTHLDLKADITDGKWRGKSFVLENVSVHT